MGKIIDLTGKTFGRLKVVGKEKSIINRKLHWVCKCTCGKYRLISTGQLMSGKSNSCGCLREETARIRRTTHGKTKSKEYHSWLGLRARCLNPKTPCYHNYGGRGIKVCDRWKFSFEKFIEDMGKSPSPLHSIERVDVNGHYEPTNCRWATSKEQANNKRPNLLVTYMGKTQTIQQWCDDLSFPYKRAWNRVKAGWSGERIFETPKRTKQI